MKRDASTAQNSNLIDAIGSFHHDPLGFVYFAFPWGEGPLKGEDGPDAWQVEVMEKIRDGILSEEDAIQIAVRSGHGIGKSALIAWIIIWFASTRPHPQIVCTANTRQQLEQKTWRELAKWHKLAINRDWFEWTATKFYLKEHPETWFAAAVPWSKEKSEAFAGTHEKHVLMLFDEASIIEDIIWEVAEGAMTTKGAMWVVFGNPTRNTGRFRECWGKHRNRWSGVTVDSRKAKMTNKDLLRQWIDDYGEDSDFVRIRVKGEFPRASSMQFIGTDLVEDAMGRQIHPSDYRLAPKVIGVDVARYGDDQSVIQCRQGLAAFKPKKYRELDNMALASIVAQEIREFRPDAVFIDSGYGTGVIDRLRQLGFDVMEVHFGGKAGKDKEYANKRCEMWGNMRDWLKAGGCIPFDEEIKADLIGPEYGFDSKDRIQLERKEDMKARGLASPDCGDALALTFAEPVIAGNVRQELYGYAGNQSHQVVRKAPGPDRYDDLRRQMFQSRY